MIMVGGRAMRHHLIRTLKDQRGSAVILVVGFLVFLLAMAGFAVDLAYQMTATGELQKSVEAAALAGASKLGFNDTVFPTVRTWAQQYAQYNPYHNPLGMLINLDPNLSNDPSGNIVLGVWANGTFTPSLDGTVVNAVRCQFNTTVPTMFLSVLGLTSLPVSAQAIAVGNPPANPPQNTCMFPIGLSSCFFGGATSIGCGATVSFISSSDQSAVGANTAAWVSLTACPLCSVDANTTRDAVTGAGSGNCSSDLSTGDTVAANNGMAQSVFNTAYDLFIQKYNTSPEYTVYKQDGQTISYKGKGWEVYVPVIDTGGACPPGAVNGEKTVVGFTRMVIAQVAKQNGDCAVANHWGGNPWDSRCFQDKNGTATTLDAGVSGSRGIFGYYDCTYYPANPSPEPVPRTSLATRLKIVKTY